MCGMEKDQTFDALQAAVKNPLQISTDSFFTCIGVSSEDILPLLQTLREKYGMNYLANLTAVDYGTEFEVVYHLYAIPDNGLKLAVKTRVTRDIAQLSSVYSVYPTADWQEREVFDLMGIRFSGHPHLERILLPDDFAGHPLRKDFRKEG